MNMTYLALFGTLALAASGCAGDFQSGGPGTPDNTGADAGVDTTPDAAPIDDPADIGTAQALFEANVRPIITASCSPGGACHSAQDPAFVSADPTSAYDTINVHRDRLYPGYDSAGATILANGAGGHYDALFTQDDVSAIEAWLAQEKIDADAGGGVAVSALQEWSGCMTLDDWEATNVADEWADKNAQGQGNCDACHNLGADGFMASNQDQRVFDTITQQPAFMPSYFTLDATGTNVVINRARLEGVGNQLAPHGAHGAFDVDGNAMEALQEFYDLTMARKLGGQCGPPRF